MEFPDQFSFSKKPIAPNGKRLSVISATLPDSSMKRTSTSSTGSNQSHNSSLTNQIRNRTFSHTDNLIEEIPTDDPLLDYDEQIRAPKFAVASKKSLDDIGNVSQDFTKLQTDDVADKAAVPPSPSPLDTSQASANANARKYQPATVALGSDSYGVSPAPSTSAANNYTLSHYITSMNVISNLETTNSSTTNTTQQTSPLSSKKNSDDSITLLSNKKTPRFALTPVRTVDDPKTPNYIPCVLRPLDSPLTQALEDPFVGDNSSTTSVKRDHWKPNGSTSGCFDCGRLFTLMNRRHHCRKCGEIFCDKCLLSKAKLNYECKFDVNGTTCKVCFGCGKQWGVYLVESFKVDMMPDFKGNLKKKKEQQGLENEGNGGSKREISNVPADWSWSSF